MKVILLNEGKAAGLDEAQGVDLGLTDRARKAAERIWSDLEAAKEEARRKYGENAPKPRGTFSDSYRKEYSMTLNADSVPYRVRVVVSYFEGKKSLGEFSLANGICTETDKYNIKDFLAGKCRYAMEIYIRLHDGISHENIESTLSHELMHTKTAVRGALRKEDELGRVLRYDTGNDDRLLTIFGMLKYYLSPDEMKSYVHNTYTDAYNLTEKFIRDNGRTPDAGEFKEMLKTESMFETLRTWIREADNLKAELRARKEGLCWYRPLGCGIENDEIQDFLDKLEDKIGFKKMTGVSTVDDFKRYFIKNADGFHLKLIKAAYKGYADAIEKHRTKYGEKRQ